jgi:hypothetical protein
VGQPPVGANPAVCWQTSPTSGDAACAKNCVVYAESGTFTLPADVCTPSATNPTSTITFINPGTGGPGTSTTALVNPGTDIHTSAAVNPGTGIHTSAAVNPGTGGPGTSTITFINPGTGIHTSAATNPGSFVSTKTTALTNPPVPTGTGTKTGGQGPVATAGAAANKVAMGGLAVLGGVAALLA